MVDESNYSEAKIQQTAIQAIRNDYPETYGLLYHIPNGGIRDPRTATIMTGQGVVPGIQDLHFLWRGKHYLIEVKTERGQIDPAQKVIHSQHKKHGMDTYIFKTSEQIIYFIKWVIEGKDLGQFDRFISPYSNENMCETYMQEYTLFRKSKLKKVV